MSLRSRLLFGPIAAIIFVCVLGLLPRMLSGYSSITQTVSEIGELGSSARLPFAAMLCVIAVCILIFASALRDASDRLERSSVAAWLTGCMAVSVAGVGIFAYPHPLHNVFGLSELIGYQAPWVLALAWRRSPQMRRLVAFSWLMAVVVWCAIIANLATLDRGGALWRLEAPIYGVVQRALFASWFVWLAGAGFMLRGNSRICGIRGARISGATE
ncbi:MAG TPA: DUF998 domain-containing protein [Rhodanobacteraceae bacterium]